MKKINDVLRLGRNLPIKAPVDLIGVQFCLVSGREVKTVYGTRIMFECMSDAGDEFVVFLNPDKYRLALLDVLRDLGGETIGPVTFARVDKEGKRPYFKIVDVE